MVEGARTANAEQAPPLTPLPIQEEELEVLEPRDRLTVSQWAAIRPRPQKLTGWMSPRWTPRFQTLYPMEPPMPRKKPKPKPPSNPLTASLKKITAALRPLARPISELREDPDNVNVHDAGSVAAIAASLDEFGQHKPVVIDADGIVRMGNGMLAAARQLGWTHLAAVPTDLKGLRAAAAAIADNQTARRSTFDDDKLAVQVAAIAAEGGALLTNLGFPQEIVDDLLGNAPAVPPSPPAIGDLYSVIVECKNEKDQLAFYKRLQKEGRKCKLSVL